LLDVVHSLLHSIRDLLFLYNMTNQSSVYYTLDWFVIALDA